MADIQPPDLETKMAILDKKAEAERITLPTMLRTFMASKTNRMCASWEGALIKLIAYSSLTGRAHQPANGAAGVEAPGCTFRIAGSPSIRYKRQWPSVFRSSRRNSKEKSNTKKVVYPRQRGHVPGQGVEPTHSLPEIAPGFGNKHHTTGDPFHKQNRINASDLLI